MISIRMLSDWSYWLDPDGNVKRNMPKGLVLTEDEDVALAAIAAEAAEPLRPLSDAQAARLEVFRLYMAGYSEDEITEMLHGATEPEPYEAPALPPDAPLPEQVGTLTETYQTTSIAGDAPAEPARDGEVVDLKAAAKAKTAAKRKV